MRQDVFSDVLTALAAAASQGKLGGALSASRPIVPSGKIIRPAHVSTSNVVLTLTAARYYSIPFYLDKAETFAGVKFKNSGTADNGFKVKIAFYNQSSSGGPGTLAKSFGEVTLDNTSAIRTLASSWTAAPGWYYGTFVSDSAAHIYATQNSAQVISSVGTRAQPNVVTGILPSFPTETFGSDGSNNTYIGDYVAGTYANFPESTAIAPTNSITGDQSSATFPDFGLYK